LVINPYLPAFAETKSIRDTFLMPLKSFVESQTGMPIRDYSTALTERDDIGDYQHANKKGSTKYMNILQQDGFFNSLTNNSLGDNLSESDENIDSQNVNISPRLEDISIVEDHSAMKENRTPPQYFPKKEADLSTNKLADLEDSKPTHKPIRKKHVKKNRHQKEEDEDWISVDSAF
jgi:hypothetical protein